MLQQPAELRKIAGELRLAGYVPPSARRISPSAELAIHFKRQAALPDLRIGHNEAWTTTEGPKG